MSEPALVEEQHGRVLVLRFNRPNARNALNFEALSLLDAGIQRAGADPEIGAVVITGTGDASFCAGMDLREQGPPEGVSEDERRRVIEAFVRLLDGESPVPLVGAANATALGGGLEVLLACDLVVASSEARFGLPEVKRGLFPGGNGTTLASRVPMAVAMQLALTGETIDAARALELHLVNTVVDPPDVLASAVEHAAAVAANAPLSLAAIRELVRLGATDGARFRERRTHWQSVVFTSEDAAEGARAFMEKREPVWTGR